MKPIVVDEGDEYNVRGYRLEGKDPIDFFGSAFEFVVVEWEHPNYDYFADAMFWWRSMHCSEWQPIAIVNWCRQYKGLGQFLKDYPELKKLFGDIVQNSSPLMRALNDIEKRCRQKLKE